MRSKSGQSEPRRRAWTWGLVRHNWHPLPLERLVAIMVRSLSAGMRERAQSRTYMKVAWFGHKTRKRGNGLVRYSDQLTEGLEARGAHVLFFYHGPPVDNAAQAPHLTRLGSLSLWDHDLISSPRSRAIIKSTLQDEKADIAHVSVSFSNLDFSLPQMCNDLGIPVVATFHAPYDRRASLWGVGSRLLYRIWSLALARYDAVVIFSHEQKAILAQCGVEPERIHVIPNGVDTHLFHPGPSTYKEELAAELLVVYCGRLDPEKNVGTLLEVLCGLQSPSCRAVVVGNGVEYERLRSRYAGETTAFTGLIKDQDSLVRILQAADVFVLPSEVEGLSIAMLEAMACGTATIATDVGCDGEALAGAGIVIDPHDLRTQLSLALKILMDNPGLRHTLGRKARRRIVSRYSLQHNTDQILQLYERLLTVGT
jgi:glycosyltransferase involved in cell wall biosynthesis